MKMLVTGGAGFIGSNFIRYILKKYRDYEVVNLDLLTYAGNLANLAEWQNDHRYQFIKGDIADKDLVKDLVGEVDTIVNFAAETHVDRSIMESAAFVHTNVAGTQTLLEAARQNGGVRFHHISTDEVFGALGPADSPFNEQTPYNPRNPYSASKAAADFLARSYYHTHCLPVTISNCCNNYGLYQFPEKIHGLFITNLLEGKKAPLYGDGQQRRSWLFVGDHCEAIDLILQKGKIGETYCIGADCEKTNLEVARKILEILGLGEEMIEYVKDRPGHDWRYAIDASKIERELGWRPRMDFNQGMRETVEWYKNNIDWWRRIKTGEYLDYYDKQYIKR